MSRFDGIATIGFQGDRASARKAIGLVQDEANRTKIRLNIEAGKGFAPLGKISSDLNQFQASLDASVARTLAFGASVGVIGGVTRAFRDMLAAGIAVEKSIADINAVFKLGSAQLQTFSSGLFDIAKNTRQSLDKVTQAATEFSRQGLSVEETLKRTGSAMTLVRLAGIDTATAVNSLTAAMNGFSSAGLDSVEIVNKLTTVDAAFAVSTSDLVQGLSRAGDVAQSAGVSFDELLAAVTAVQQRTARGGAIIGNSLKTILTRLQSPENTKALESIGVSVYDSNGAFREGIQILKDYAAARSNLADSERAGLDKKLAGGYQINSFLALLAELKDRYGAFNQAVEVSKGATDEAKKRMELLNNTVAALGAKLSATGTQLSSFIFNSAFEDGAKMALGQIQAVGDALTTFLNPETIKGGGLKGVFAGLTQGAFEGVGKFIFGGGGIEALRVMSKLIVFLSTEAYKAAAQVASIGSQKQKEEQYARRISSLLQQDVEYMRLMGNGSLTNLEFQKETAKALERQALIAERILSIQKQIRAFVPANPAIVSRVIKDTGGKGGLFGAAGGYSPIDLGKAKEKGMIQNGVGGARLSDKPKVIRGFDFGGGKKGTIVANTGEHYVPNFGGAGDAIFNRDMIAKYGLPSGAVPVAGGFVPNFARTKKENPFAPIDTYFVNALLKKEMRAVRDSGIDYTSPEGKREVLLGVQGKLETLNLSSAAKEEAIRQLARVTRDYATYSPSDVRVEGGKKDAKFASVLAREAEVAKREELNQKQRAARVVEYDISKNVGLIYGRRGPLTRETYENFDRANNLTRIIKFKQAGMKLENPEVDAQLDSLHEKVWKDAQYAVNSYIGAITGTRPAEDIPASSFSNKNAVNSLLGTAFETALSQTMGSKLEREGGQNATIDFPSPTQPMRSLFHRMSAAQYEAKYIPNDDAHKSLFNKAIKLGLVDAQFSAAKLSAMDAAYAAKQGATAAAGFIPNFAMDMRWASDRMDSVVYGGMTKRLNATGKRLGLPRNKVSLKNLAPTIEENVVGGKYNPSDRSIQVHARDDVSIAEIEEILAHEYGHFIDYAHPSAQQTGVKMSDLPDYRSEAKRYIKRYIRDKKDPKIPKWVKKSLSTILAHKHLYSKDNYYEELYADGVAELHGPRRHPVSKSKLGSLIASDIRLPKKGFAGGYIPNFSAIQDAMGREAAAIGDSNGVRIGTHPSLKSPFNKEGIGVYNNREGSLGAGIQMARMAGVEDVKSKGMVPNFAKYSYNDTQVAKEIEAAGKIKIHELVKKLGMSIKEVGQSLDNLGVAAQKVVDDKKSKGGKRTSSARTAASEIDSSMVPSSTLKEIKKQNKLGEQRSAYSQKDFLTTPIIKRLERDVRVDYPEVMNPRAVKYPPAVTSTSSKNLPMVRGAGGLSVVAPKGEIARVVKEWIRVNDPIAGVPLAKDVSVGPSPINAPESPPFIDRTTQEGLGRLRYEQKKVDLMRRHGRFSSGGGGGGGGGGGDGDKPPAPPETPKAGFPQRVSDYFDKSGWKRGELGKAGSSAFSEGKFFDKATRGMNAFAAQMAVSAAAGGLAAAGFKNGAKAAESVASGFQAATTAAALIPGPFGAMAGVAVGVGTALFSLASKFSDKTDDLAKSLDAQILKNAEVAQSLSGAIASYDKFTIAMEKNDPTRAFRAYSEMAEQIGKAATNNPAISGKFFSAIAEKDPEKRSEAFQTLQQEVSKTEQRAKDARDSIELARTLGEKTLTSVEGRGILQKRQDENFSYADLSTALKEITASLKADSSRANADAQYEKLKTLVDNPAQLEAIRTAIYESGVDGWFDVTSSLVEFLNDAAANLGEGADTKSFLEEMSKKMKPILDAEIAARKKAMEASNKFDIAMLKASVSTQFFASQLKGQFAFEAKKRSIDFESASDILSSLDLITPEQGAIESGARSKAEIETQTKEQKRLLGIEVAQKLDSLASEIGTGQNPKNVEALTKLAELSSSLKDGADVKQVGEKLNEESFRKLLDKDGKDSKTEEYLKKLIEIGADAINNDTALSEAERQEKALQDAKTRAELNKLIVDRYKQATMDSGGLVQAQKDIEVLAGTSRTVEDVDAKEVAHERTGKRINYTGSEDIDLLKKKRMLAHAQTIQEGTGAYGGERLLIAGGEEEIVARVNEKLGELNAKGSLSGKEQAAKSLYEQIIAQSRVVKDSQSDYNDTTPKGPSAEVKAIYAGLQTASNTLKRDFDALKQATVELGKAMDDASGQRGAVSEELQITGARRLIDEGKRELGEARASADGGRFKRINSARAKILSGETAINKLAQNDAPLSESGKTLSVSRLLQELSPLREEWVKLKSIFDLADGEGYQKEVGAELERVSKIIDGLQKKIDSIQAGGKAANARGYISRNFASGKSNRISEMLAASAAGYKTPLSASEVRTGIVDGNVVTYNSRESIVRSGGATAIIPPRDSKAFNSFGKNAAAGSDSYGNKELASILREIQRGQEKVIAAVQSNRTVSLDGDVGINANVSAAISSANLSSEVAQIIKSEIEKSLPALIKKAVQDSVALSVKTITKLF